MSLLLLPNQALQRTRHGVAVSNRCVPSAGSLSLGRSANNNMFSRLSIILLTFSLSSCAHYTKKGDVRFFESDGKLPFLTLAKAVPSHRMELPDISLSQKDTFVIRVRDLPEPMFPDWSRLRVPQEEDSKYIKDQPWRSVIVQFTYKDLAGNILGKTKVDFSRDWNGNSSPGGHGKRQIGIRISPWTQFEAESFPPHNNYDIIIEVISPSQRQTDFLRTNASKHVHRK